MKNVFLIFTLVAIFSLNAGCQDAKEVPADVKTAFSQKFPDASKVKWSMESETEWEAEFKMDGKEYSANFDTKGTWLETEYKVEMKDLPDAVKNTLKSEFEGYEIEEIEMVETADGKFYELEIEKDDKEMEILIDLNGKVIKKELENEDEEEEFDEDED